MKLTVDNQTCDVTTVTLEPIGDSFDLQPDTTAEIELSDPQSALKLDLYSNNRINLWTEGDLRVTVGSQTMDFPDLLNRSRI